MRFQVSDGAIKPKLSETVVGGIQVPQFGPPNSQKPPGDTGRDSHRADPC